MLKSLKKSLKKGRATDLRAQTGREKLAYELLCQVQTLLSAQSAGEACFFAVMRSLGLALCAATCTCPCFSSWASHQLPLARSNGACRHRASQKFLKCLCVCMRVCVYVCMMGCLVKCDFRVLVSYTFIRSTGDTPVALLLIQDMFPS